MTVMIPTANKRMPTHPTLTNIVARSWDRLYLFWTLDLSGKRYIVKLFNGNRMRYRSWAGPAKGFEKTPLAISPRSPKKPRRPKTVEQPSPEAGPAKGFEKILSSSSSLIDEIVKSLAFPGARKPCHPTTIEQPSPEQDSTLSDDDKLMAMFMHVDLLEENLFSSSSSTDEIAKDCEAEPTVTTHVRDLDGRDEQKNPTGGKRHSESEIVFSSDGKPLLDASARRQSDSLPLKHDHPGKRMKTDLSAQRPDLQHGLLQIRHSADTGILNAMGKLGTEGGLSIGSPIKEVRKGSKSSALSTQFEQENTVLMVRLSPSYDYRPVPLSACLTREAFFKEVSKVWKIDERDIDHVTASSRWEGGCEIRTTLTMGRKGKHSLSSFMEHVQDAPGWAEEKLKCKMDVDVILKSGLAKGVEEGAVGAD